jgi:hypothetical protein
MLTFISIKTVLGILAGGVFGFGLYKLVGCSTGACPLTANPWISTVYGAVMGFLITRM